jgi:hypothetical protein
LLGEYPGGDFPPTGNLLTSPTSPMDTQGLQRAWSYGRTLAQFALGSAHSSQVQL